MSYKFITEVAHDLQNEDGHPDAERTDYLESLVQDLRQAQAYATALAARKPVAAPGAGARDLAKFYNDSAAHQKAVEAANENVIMMRQWITRMGGVLDRSGNLDVAKSARVVQYDRQLAQQGLTKVTFRGGLLIDATGKELDTSNMVTAFSGPGKGIYALSATNDGLGGGLHVTSHSVGERHHSSLLAATQAWIAGAGEIEVKKGTIQWISNKSGHYQPTLQHFLQVLHHLDKNQVQPRFRIQFHDRAGHTNYASLDAFMHAKGLDDDSYDYFNLVKSYSSHLNPAVLGPHGWEYRPRAVRPGVYDMYTDRFIPHREVRSWLKHNSLTGTPQEHSGAGR